MPLFSRPVSRRMTLAVAPLLLAASCRWGPEDETDPQASPGSGKTPSPRPSDDEQVAAAVNAIHTMEAFVSAASVAHVGLSTPLARLVALHAGHRALLEPGRAAALPEPSVPATSGAALIAVRRREQSLQQTLATLASEVSSGTLARTLASMAAAVAQHLQRLPAAAKEGQA